MNVLLKEIENLVSKRVALSTLLMCSSHSFIVKQLVNLYVRCRLHYYFKNVRPDDLCRLNKSVTEKLRLFCVSEICYH